MMEINERVAKVETRVDSLEERATIHGKELDEMRIKNATQDAKLDSIERKVTESCEVTRKISGGVDTVKWLLAGVSTLGGLWLMIKQMGWF